MSDKARMQPTPTPSPYVYKRYPLTWRFSIPRPQISPWTPPPKTGVPDDLKPVLSWLGRHGLAVAVGAFVLIRFYRRRREEQGGETSVGETVTLGLSSPPVLRARGEDPLARIGELWQEAVARPSELAPRLELGRRLVDSGRGREAVPVLREAVLLAPSDAAVHLALGRALASTLHPEDALAAIDEAVRLRGDFSEAYEARGDVLAEAHWSVDATAVPEAMAAWTEAIRLCRDQLAAEPANASVRARLGGLLVRLGQREAALPELERAARERRSDADVQRCLAETLDDLGRSDEAEAQYRVAAAAQRKLAEANPRHAGHQARLAELLNELGEEGDDDAWLDALLLDPEYPNVADVVAEHGDEGAEPLIAAAQALSAGRWQEAADRFRATLEQWPPVAAHALCGLGEALSQLGKHAVARKAFERALALRPGWWRPQEGLAQLHRTP